MTGVEPAQVHFSTGRIEVEHDESLAAVEDLVAAVKAVGYNAAPRAF